MDGWFHDKMKDAVTLFQEWAEKGQFLINGVLTDTGEKLTGHRKGVLCPKTQEHLQKVVDKGGKVPVPTVDKGEFLFFPLLKKPKETYKDGPRRFGAERSHGKRLHAGCDLYAPEGTEVFAVKDGTIILGPYDFYQGTIAIEVDHGSFIGRYTEMKNVTVQGIKVGAKITGGQLIGYIGKLEDINFTMLHFEMYSGKSKGPLTDKTNAPYMRRIDLIDPTEYIDKMILKEKK